MLFCLHCQQANTHSRKLWNTYNRKMHIFKYTSFHAKIFHSKYVFLWNWKTLTLNRMLSCCGFIIIAYRALFVIVGGKHPMTLPKRCYRMLSSFCAVISIFPFGHFSTNFSIDYYYCLFLAHEMLYVFIFSFIYLHFLGFSLLCIIYWVFTRLTIDDYESSFYKRERYFEKRYLDDRRLTLVFPI